MRSFRLVAQVLAGAALLCALASAILVVRINAARSASTPALISSSAAHEGQNISLGRVSKRP